MIKNFQELISQIKTQVPIQELISEFIPIKRSGRGYVALCPFHDDHHPSLQIHPQKGIFKCFSCGTGGDLITFYALINKKKWSEVIPELASKYGLKVEYGTENKTELQVKGQLHELNKVVVDFYKNNLFQQNGNQALNYLKEERKLSNDTIEKHEIGFAQNSWDSLLNHLTKTKGYPQELLIASGLFIQKENQSGYYDRFRNRVIFPIYDEGNKIVGFGGRTLSKDEVKYINSPETLIFNKSQILYGFNFAKEEIKKSGYVILTEGYLDVITAQENDLLNTVATLGTALTLQQVRLLTKYSDSKRIYLCLDTDAAGKKAIESIFKLTQGFSRFIPMDLRVVSELKGKDLDEALKNEDPKTVKSKILNSQKLTHFIFNRIINDYNDTSDDLVRKNILDESLEIIISLVDPIEQNESIKLLAHKLNIDEDLISIKLKDKAKLQKQRAKRFQKSDTKDSEDSYKMHSIERFKHAELELLSFYINSFPHNIDEIKSDLSKVEFLDEKHKLIKDFLDNIANKELTSEEIINQLFIEFNEYKHIASTISDLAWRVGADSIESANYAKKKEKLISEAKESISWWVTNKQKMNSLRSSLKECKSKEEEKEILTKMMDLLKG